MDPRTDAPFTNRKDCAAKSVIIDQLENSTNLSVGILLVSAAGLLLLQWPLRRLMRWLLGPLFPVEVARLSRRGSAFWLRAGYAVALLAALYAKFPVQSNLEPNLLSNFALEFTELFLLVQAVAVLVLTPIWFCGAISDEKERRSLDFLLTSQLSSREIVLGKYTARLLALVGLLLAGLPVLVLTLFWGGVDLVRVLTLFAAALLSLFSQGAICMVCSVLASTTTGAIARAFIAIFIMSCCCTGMSLGIMATPIQFQFPVATKPGLPPASPQDQLEDLGEYAIVHSLLTFAMLGVAIWQLRMRAGPPPRIEFAQPQPKPEEKRDSIVVEPTPLQALMALHPDAVPPIDSVTVFGPPPEELTFWHPIGEHAVIWKDRYRPGVADLVSDSLWLYFGVLIAALIIPAVLLPHEIKVVFDASQIFLTMFPLLTIGLSAGLMLQLAGSITREREQRTLESLLVLPESRGRVLLEKWLGAVLRRLRWFIAIGALAGIGVISGMLTPWTGILVATLATAQALLVSAVSLVASLLSQTTVRAHVAVAITVLAFLIVSVFGSHYERVSMWGTSSVHLQLRAALNPVSAWLLVRDLNRPGNESKTYLVASLAIGISTYLAFAGALGSLALWHFRRLNKFE